MPSFNSFSALTAGLRNGSSTAPALNGKSHTAGKLNQEAFPCLLHAAAGDEPPLNQQAEPGSNAYQEDLATGIEPADLSAITIVGSAASNTQTPSGLQLDDYPLHPCRRRGGKETCLPSSLSLSSSLRGGSSLRSNRGRQQQQQSGSSLSRNYEAVVGSLPKGLSAKDRARLRASVPRSPAAGSLTLLSQDKVSARTPEGRQLRLNVLRGSIVVFITAGYSGKRFIFEKCQQLGVKAVVLDGPDSWAQLMVPEGLIAKFLPIDFSDADNVYSNCLAAIRETAHEFGGVDGVTSFCEMAVPLAARLAEALGLPGNTPDAVDAARDKHATRCCLSAAGLPTPRHARISVPSDVAVAAQVVGFPAVIKPVAGAASIGVIRVDDEEQLQRAYERVVRDLSRAKVVAGALVEGDDNDAADDIALTGNAGAWIKVELMLEEYLDGPEVDVDVVFSDGAAQYAAVTDNWPTVEPYFNETGSNCPSVLPRRQQQELIELAINSVKALGFQSGVFHCEAKMTRRGARLIEVNARMGGGCVRDTNLLVWGVDLVEEQLMCSVGIPARPLVAQKPLVQMAEYCINAKASGVLRHTHYLDQLQQHPDVIFTSYLVPAGSKVVCVADGLPTWVCEVMVVKPTVAEAVAFMQQIEETLDIPIDPMPLASHC